MSLPVWLAAGTAYSPTAAADIPLRVATGRFNTEPTDTPPSVHFLDRLKDPGRIKRTMFADGTTMGRGKIGSGDFIVSNPDGELDAWLPYGFDGRTWTLYYGQDTAAFPSGFTTMLTGQIELAEFDIETVKLKWRDNQAKVEVPVQTTKYAGTNSLPAGLEGVAGDLKGKPKPLVFGKVRNIAPPCVNTSKLIYQISANAISAIDEVRDGGVSLGAAGFTSVDDSTPYTKFRGLAYAPDIQRWVTGGTVGSAASRQCATSDDDGVTWTFRPSPTTGSVTVIVYSEDLRLFVMADNAGAIYTSPDGEAWTSRTSTFGGTAIQCGFWAPSVDLFVLAGTSGKLATSPDGVTWTSRTANMGTETILGAYWSDSETLGVVVGTTGSCASSPDCTTWTARTTGASETLACVAFQDLSGLWVTAGGDTTSQLYTSSDAITWTSRTSGFGTDTISCVAVGTRYLFTGGTNGKIGQSTDAINWTVTQPSGFNAANTMSAIGVSLVTGAVIVTGPAGLGLCPEPSVTYSSEADLLDDTLAPAPGAIGAYLAGGLFRLGSAPNQEITCDVTQGAAASNRTAAQGFVFFLDNYLGMTTGDWSASDVTTADAANSAVCGFWTGLEEMTGAQVLDKFAASVGAGWWPDVSGVFRFKILTAPSTANSVMTFTEEFTKGLTRISGAMSDPSRRSPYRTKLRYSRNYTPQTVAELGGSVTDALRSEYGEEWKEVVSTDSAVQAKHPLAPELAIDSLIAEAADAATEVARVQALRGTDRDMYVFHTPFNTDTAALDVGSTITLNHERFGLTTPKAFTILSIETVFNERERDLRIECWG